MADLSKSLQNKIKKLTNNVDNLADELDKNIDKYQRQYERELQAMSFGEEDGRFKSTQANYNKVNGLKMSKRLKWSAIVQEHIDKYGDLPLFNKEFHESIGIEVDEINYNDLTVVKEFQSQDAQGLLTEGQTLDNLVRKELVNAIALNSPVKDAISNLAAQLLGSTDKKIGRLSRYSQTYVRTSMMGLSRLIDKEVYDTLDLKDEFLYAGTVDQKIREFCKHHVGKTYTNEQIEKFPTQNGSGLDPFFSPGGWNCRHRLIATDLL